MSKVLIVEDDPSTQILYKLILEFNGVKVSTIASDGMEAVSLFKSMTHKPHIILMDHHMPLKTGLKATKEILEINKEVKIIFITSELGLKEKALAIGVCDFLEKPINPSNLIRTIKKYVHD